MLLSDMLEDCDNVNFERRAPDASETARILEQTEQARELPNLGGVRVYVVELAFGSCKLRGKFTSTLKKMRRLLATLAAALPHQLRPASQRVRRANC